MLSPSQFSVFSLQIFSSFLSSFTFLFLIIYLYFLSLICLLWFLLIIFKRFSFSQSSKPCSSMFPACFLYFLFSVTIFPSHHTFKWLLKLPPIIVTITDLIPYVLYLQFSTDLFPLYPLIPPFLSYTLTHLLVTSVDLLSSSLSFYTLHVFFLVSPFSHIPSVLSLNVSLPSHSTLLSQSTQLPPLLHLYLFPTLLPHLTYSPILSPFVHTSSIYISLTSRTFLLPILIHFPPLFILQLPLFPCLLPH